MKEWLFQIKDQTNGISRTIPVCVKSSSEDEAWRKITNVRPNAEKLNCWEIDDVLRKLLNAIHWKPGQNPWELINIEDIEKQDPIDQVERDIETNKANKLAGMSKSEKVKYEHEKWKETLANEVLKNYDKNELLTTADWNKLLSSLNPQQRTELKNELIKDAQTNWKDDKKNLAKELHMIDYIFGDKKKGSWKKVRTTVREIADEWGTSHVYVTKVQQKALEKIAKAIARIHKYPFKMGKGKEAFLNAIKMLNHG